MGEAELKKGTVLELNKNGFSFQYAVLQRAHDLSDAGESPFVFNLSEFPVEVKGRPTHIDFVLRHKHAPFYLVCECKRADPARANWCFLRSPYVSRGTDIERVVREVVVANSASSGGSVTQVTLDWIERSRNIYRIPISLRSDGKGESHDGDKFFSDAVSQVLRGMNGLIQLAIRERNRGSATFFASGRNIYTGHERHYAAFMPVVFTTAKLWTCDANLAASDIETGNIDPALVELKPVEWLYFQYDQSPSLKHDHPHPRSTHLPDLMYQENTRTVCVVSPAGMKEFLARWTEEEDWIPPDAR